MRRRIYVGIFVLILITIVLVIIQQICQHYKSQYISEDEILTSLKDGDVICRLGDRIWSKYFKELSPNEKKFSHLGIIRIRNNTVTVINAEGLVLEGKDYVNEVSLKDFLNIAQRVGIFRLRTIDGCKISDAALEYKGRPFDWHFDMEEDKNIYCSELLYIILKKLDRNINLNTIWLKNYGKNIIPLDVCFQSEYFYEVGYWDKL